MFAFFLIAANAARVAPKIIRRTKPIPVALGGELIERIDQIAAKIGENRSVVMRISMRIGLDKLEASLEPGEPFSLTREMLNDARRDPIHKYPTGETQPDIMRERSTSRPEKPRRVSGKN